MTRFAIPLILVLALGACSRTAPPSSAPASSAPPSSAPEAATIPWRAYVCADGRVLRALYPDATTAQVKLEGGTFRLKTAVSGSGVRYVGEGLQWWSKGEEGLLATLKPGETIAADPGVRCVPPARAPVEPPAPGTPGGLPDDRTPLDERPARAGSAQAAATVVETYYALVESGRTAEASRLRTDGVAEDVTRYATLNAQVGGPGPVEGAAGSLFVEVPVVLYGRYADGAEYHASGKVTLRRVNDVPGATEAQLRWRIGKIEVK